MGGQPRSLWPHHVVCVGPLSHRGECTPDGEVDPKTMGSLRGGPNPLPSVTSGRGHHHIDDSRQPRPTGSPQAPASRVLSRAILLGGEKRERGGLTPNKSGSARGETTGRFFGQPELAHWPTPQWVVSKTYWPCSGPYADPGHPRMASDPSMAWPRRAIDGIREWPGYN